MTTTMNSKAIAWGRGSLAMVLSCAAGGNTLKRGEQLFLSCLIIGAIGLLALIPLVGAINSSHITIAKLMGSSGLF
jgi:hypothetical protein